MNTKFFPQWLRLTAALVLLLAALAPVSFAYADSCLVTTIADSGEGSLRDKIADPLCDTINFDGDYTIVLASQLIIGRNLTIDGTGYSITVSGNNAVRVFEVNSGVTFNLQNLTVANGNADGGGGIYNRGTLNVTNSTFSGNTAAHGGGIFSDGGTLTVTGSTFTGNSATYGGGGLTAHGTLNVTNSAFSSNSAHYGAGIHDSDGGTVTNSTFSGNSAVESGGGIMTGGAFDTKLLTVTNSTFTGNSAAYGGGIHNYRGTTNVTNNTFTDNSATYNGGGIYVNSGMVTVMDSAFTGNSATYGGGGIYTSHGTLNVENTSFSNNNTVPFGAGGGIYDGGDGATVSNSTFTGNTAAHGGGIASGGVTLMVTGSTFTGNSATYGGGGITATSTLTVMNSTFSGNSADGGGGIHHGGDAATVTNSTFSNNSATVGGGIFTSGIFATKWLTVANSTFSGNSATYTGGGIHNYSGTAAVTNSTFSGNSATAGGGIYVNSGTATVRNTIVANSASGLNCAIYEGSGTIGGSHNLVDDTSCPNSATSPSILLGPLADNGGATQTMALLPGSAAIDAGDDTVCPGTDQRGVTRPQGAHCDIGAYEMDEVITDTTPPTITLTTPPEGAVYLLGQTVNADYTCQDEAGGSGLASCVGSVPNGSPIDTGSIGAKTFTVNAADNAGNVASATHNYQVIYAFTGFISPVDNPPVINIAKAGQTIPLKWRITDANGNPVTDLTDVTVTAVSLSCPSVPTTDAIEEYATSNSGLQNLGDGYYQWNWRSPASYANSCKTLILDLGEGAGFEHLALFQFWK